MLKRAATLIGISVLAFAAGTLAFFIWDSRDDDQSSDVQTAPESMTAAIMALVEDVRPSVVAVTTDKGEGSGVVWDSSHVVTNNHVIDGATTIKIVLASGGSRQASLVAADPLTDLAVLEIDGSDLHPATFSDSVPHVGSVVLAIGNPLGFENSATLGIVSGLNRSIPSGGAAPALVDLIQTDAAISPGNSGGALISAAGYVVGINVAYIPPSASAVSLGFAIPSPTAIHVVEQLLSTGSVEHAFLGVEPRPLTPEIASRLGLGVSEGVVAFRLTPGGPAAMAGVEPGDVIIEFNKEEVASVEDLFSALRAVSPGETVSLTIVREEKEQELQVSLTNRPAL